MKLHLPKKFTAALLAACTAVALASTAAAAATGTATFTGGETTIHRGDTVFEDLYATNDITTGTTTAGALTLSPSVSIYPGSGNFYARDYTLSIWVTQESLKSNQLLFSYGGTGVTSNDYGANAIFWNADNSTITIGRGKVTNTYSSMTWKENQTTASLASALGEDTMINLTFSVSGNDGNEGAKLGQIVDIYVNGEKMDGQLQYNGGMNNSATSMNYYVTGNATYGTISLTNERLTNISDIYALMGVSTEEPAKVTNYVWKGTQSTEWDTVTANWVTKEASTTPVEFTSGEANTVLMDSIEGIQEVTLVEDVTIGNLTVSDNYTIKLEESLTTDSLNVTTGASLAIASYGGGISVNSITVESDASLTLDTASVTSLGGVDNSGTLNLSVASESTWALTPSLLSGTGKLVKQGEGVMTLSADLTDSFQNTIEVAGGTLKLRKAGGSAYHAVVVDSDAVVDINGANNTDYHYRYTLNGGTLTNEGANTGAGSVQNDQITLSAESTVTGSKNFYMLAGGFGATYLNLNGNTLHKTGTNTFSLISGNVNEGVLDVQGGTVEFNTGHTTANVKADIILNGGNIAGKYKYTDSETAVTRKLTANQTVTTNAAIEVGNNVTLDANVADSKTLTMSGVISGNGGLTKDGTGILVLSGANTYTGDTVVKGGTLDIQGSISDQSKVRVAQDATITGEIDNISLGIDVGKTATIKDAWGFTPKESELTFFSESGEVKVQNTGDTEITYGIGEENAKVTADGLMSGESGDSPVVVKNAVFVKSIAQGGAGALTLANVNADTLESVYAYDGSISLLNTSAVSLTEMTIVPKSTVSVYTDGQATTEGTVTIKETLAAGGGTLLANLTLVSDSTLDLSLMDGGMQALTLGSALTFDFSGGSGSHVNLDEATIAALSQLQDGGKLDLIVAKEQTELTYGGNGYDGMSYSDLFNRADGLVGDYKVYANGAAFGLMKSTSPIPEPTTGSLSLLALAGLCARRRKK